MKNNRTSEIWTWKAELYYESLVQLSDFKNFSQFFITAIYIKICNLTGAFLSFMILSFVNGIVIRMLLTLSNILIFPMMAVIACCTRRNIDHRVQAAIYQSLGIMGAQMAHLDRQGGSKTSLVLAVLACLFMVYFVQSAVIFIWARIFLPHTYAGGLNDGFFGYNNFLEFSFFIFIRTRLSIKYYSKLVTILNVTLMLYIYSYQYSA